MVKVEKPHLNCKFSRQSRIRLYQTFRRLYPGDSKYSKFRKKCRSLVLISDEIGRKLFLPMGSAGYIFEMEQQLTQHKYMIHPYSKFYHYWKILAILEFIISFLIRLPLISHWSEYFYNPLYQIAALFSDLFETTDVLMRLLVGYVSEENQSVILEFRKVFYRNLLNCLFYVDLFVSLPFDFIMYLFYRSHYYSVHDFVYFSYLKVLKLISLSRDINQLSKVYNWNELCFQFILFSFITLHFGHWLSCVLYTGSRFMNFTSFAPSSNENTENFLHRHFECFYVICTIFLGQTTAFSQKLFDTAINDNISWIFFINLLSFLQIFFLSLFIQLIALTKTSKLVYEGLKQEIQKLLAQENLPRHVHLKALKFLKFRYNGTYFDENAILETLSPPLKREVKNFLCYDLVINSESIFNCLPEDLASRLCLHMKLKIYIAGDTIFRAGQKSSSIYFLYSGSVVIYSSRGQELTHWYKGQQFGVASFMESHLYLLTAVALETSEIYVLRHSDFVEVTKNNPELFKTVYNAASARIDMLLKDFSLDKPHD